MTLKIPEPQGRGHFVIDEPHSTSHVMITPEYSKNARQLIVLMPWCHLLSILTSAQNLPTFEVIENQHDNDGCRSNLGDASKHYDYCRHLRASVHRTSEETRIAGLQEMQTPKTAGMSLRDIDTVTDEHDG